MKKLLLLLVSIFTFMFCFALMAKASPGMMGYTGGGGTPAYTAEDYTTYTTSGSGFTVASSTSITYTGLVATDTSRVYKDFGTGYFGTNFTHYVDVVWTSKTGGSLAGVWMVSNSNTDAIHTSTDNLDIYVIGTTGGTIYLNEIVGGTQYYSSAFNMTTATTYYLQIQRNSSVGTYGTLYCYVYDTSAHRTAGGATGLLATLSVTLHNNTTWRYLYAADAYGATSGTVTITGTIGNLKIVQ
jgi:hypothetical protein